MSLFKNAAFNFLGAAVPALIAIATIPYIVFVLGVSDYGLLALITSIVGYFALLDINITASSTKYVSEFKASGDVQRLNETICFGLLTYASIGLIGMTCLYFFAPMLVSNVFSIPVNRQNEAITVIQIAAFGFLFGQVQAYLQSLPGALMRFDVSGRVEAVFGTIVPTATVGLLYAGYGLVELVWLRVGLSLLQAWLIWHILRKLLPMLRWSTPNSDIRNLMLSFSAYSFLSRLAALTYANADKLIISAHVGVAALAFYVVPVTLVNRVMSLVYRLSGVMFPHASALAAQGRLDELERDYVLATRYLFFINGSIALVLATLASPILSLWLSPEFARTGTTVMVMIALAQWADSTTNLPTLVNDGLAHPKVSGMFALLRAALGLGSILAGVWRFGIAGAAGAHLIVSIVMSTVFVIYVHGRTVPIALRLLVWQAYLPGVLVLIPVGLAGFFLSSFAQLGWLHLVASASMMCALLLAVGFLKICIPRHRQTLLARLSLKRQTKEL